MSPINVMTLMLYVLIRTAFLLVVSISINYVNLSFQSGKKDNAMITRIYTAKMATKGLKIWTYV